MTNAAILAARLSGRPLLMRAAEAEAYGRQLLQGLGPDRRTGFAGLLAAARRAVGAEPKDTPKLTGPACYYPMWLGRAAGEPDGAGFGWTLKAGVALVEIAGPLLDQGWVYDGEVWLNGYDTLAETFAEIAADARVKGVFIRYDTPGGVVDDGLPVLSAKLRALRDQKPVWAWCNLAASAGYWLAASNSRVLAPKIGVVGSIGAVSTHCDMSGMLEKDGLKLTQIQFGAKKTDGSPYKPLSPSAQADWQSEIDDVGAMFVAEVVAGRPALTPEAVLATEAGCFLAGATEPTRSGLELGLVDAIAGEAEAFAALLEHINPSARRAGANPTQTEAAMANPNRKTAAKPAPATPATAAAAAPVVRPAAAAPDDGYEDCETCDGTGMNADGSDCADCGGDGQVEVDAPTAAAPASSDTSAAEAAAITASPEATAHPHLALAAIGSGQTLAQFQASVAALAHAPKGSKLDRAMAGAARLGPDAPHASASAPALDASAIFAKRREATKA